MMDHAEEEDGMAARGRRTARELKRCSMVGVAINGCSMDIVGGVLSMVPYYFVINTPCFRFVFCGGDF